MSVATTPYLEFADFVAKVAPESVANFHPSAESQARLSDLLEREKCALITEAEKNELDHFMEMEHIIRMAKARAKLILARGD